MGPLLHYLPVRQRVDISFSGRIQFLPAAKPHEAAASPAAAPDFLLEIAAASRATLHSLLTDIFLKFVMVFPGAP